jgi:hypothetical protein
MGNVMPENKEARQELYCIPMCTGTLYPCLIMSLGLSLALLDLLDTSAQIT